MSDLFPARASKLSEVGKYDMVCAVTQKSLNSTMKEYLFNGEFPEVIACYIMRRKTPERPAGLEFITYEELLERTGGTDPFDVPNNTDPDDPIVMKLRKVNFRCAIKFRVGWPESLEPMQYRVLDLRKYNVDNVDYNMFCSEFQVVEYKSDEDAPEWFNLSQTADEAWVFTSQVSLMMKEVNTDSLPEDVKKAIEKIRSGTSLSVQRLFLDLNDATMKTIPTITGLPDKSTAKQVLKDNFLGTYFDDMKKKGQPILYVGVVDDSEDRSEFRPTAMHRDVVPYRGTNPPDKDSLTTLNYLCMAFDHKWPGRSEIPWDWIGPGDSKQAHGVMAINRNTFAKWFVKKLKPHAKKNIFKPWTNAWWRVWVRLEADLVFIGDSVEPEFEYTKTGDSLVTKYEWIKRSDSSMEGLGVAVEPAYQCEVTFAGSEISIWQRLACWLKVKGKVTSTNGNIMDKQVTDKFRLYVDGYDGSLQFQHIPGEVKDTGKVPPVDLWQKLLEGSSMENITDKLSKSLVQNIELDNVPVESLQSFMFPGGKVFAFSNAQFSDNQDLIAFLTYATPSQVEALHSKPVSNGSNT